MDNLFGEFMGTMLLLAFGGGVCANLTLNKSKAQGGSFMEVTTGWAFAVLVGVFTAKAFGAPQADLNPAVTLAKTFLGTYTFDHALITMLAQLAGAFVGAVFVWIIYLPHWKITENQASKLGIFSTAPAIRNYPANFICETLVTCIFILAIFCIFHEKNGVLPDGYGPYMVACLVWGVGLSFGGPTGFAINPARDLGPRIAHFLLPIAGKGDSDWGYAWVPVFAPLTGAVLAYLIAITTGLL